MDDMAKKELLEHLRHHMQYPATKKAIVEACNMMEHVPAEARDKAKALADKTYQSAEEVVKAIGL